MTTRRVSPASLCRLGAERVCVCAESVSFPAPVCADSAFIRVHLAPTRRLNAAVDDLALPDGLTSRPLTMADAQAVYEVMAAQEQHDLGKVEIEPADIIGDWQKPSFDVAASTVGVFDGDTLGRLRRGQPVRTRRRGRAPVVPPPRDRYDAGRLDAGPHRRAGRRRDRQPGPRGVRRRPAPGEAGLEGPLDQLGAEPARGRADPGTTAARRLPDPHGHARRLPRRARGQGGRLPRVVGARPRAARGLPGDQCPSAGLRAVAPPGGHRPGRRGRRHGAGEMYGEPPTEAFIGQLAVRRDQRRRGLAQALLVDAFALGREHGATRSALSTDSRTGALGLYQKVGMEVGDVWVNRATERLTAPRVSATVGGGAGATVVGEAADREDVDEQRDQDPRQVGEHQHHRHQRDQHLHRERHPGPGRSPAAARASVRPAPALPPAAGAGRRRPAPGRPPSVPPRSARAARCAPRW